MYFVYQKSIASEYSYNVESIIEWFKNYIDGDYIKTVYEKAVTARDIVDDIFCEPEEYDYAEFIITWLKDNLKNYKEEFLSILDSEIDTEGEISNDNITELLDNEEFMKEFKQYLCD